MSTLDVWRRHADLRRARMDHLRLVMADYDDTVYTPALTAQGEE